MNALAGAVGFGLLLAGCSAAPNECDLGRACYIHLRAELDVSVQTSPAHIQILRDAAQQWSDATRARAELTITVRNYPESLRPEEYHVSNWHAALTSRFCSDPATDVVSNACTNERDHYIVLNADDEDLVYQSTALHELGHFFGLLHSPNADDVMWADSRAVALTGHDVAAFERMY
jgi:predicted Zn-dependent protease